MNYGYVCIEYEKRTTTEFSLKTPLKLLLFDFLLILIA